MKSPITDGPTELLAQFEARQIAERYRHAYQYDISALLPQDTPIQLWKCIDTGYTFFSPFTTMGNNKFYESLYQRLPKEVAYPKLRWDFERALSAVPKMDHVLDVGCGSGEFLRASLGHGRAISASGLETSAFGRDAARESGLTVFSDTIEVHAEDSSRAYDTITAFQVLEHLWNVRGFFTACSKLLRPGGRLVVSVPNNASFVGRDQLLPLNCPPHHMGRWDPHSLRAIDGRFGLELLDFDLEPLQEHNISWYQALAEQSMLANKGWLFKQMYYRGGVRAVFRKFLCDSRREIAGHTMLAVFRKISS